MESSCYLFFTGQPSAFFPGPNCTPLGSLDLACSLSQSGIPLGDVREVVLAQSSPTGGVPLSQKPGSQLASTVAVAEASSASAAALGLSYCWLRPSLPGLQEGTSQAEGPPKCMNFMHQASSVV
uniref:Uncharacterized protein n=1 Tax=Pipistrellus kuhlii TaxID=59472 RepID=A0A7J7UM16_PIPKU|nr:hypothetical protein mPipKuh1_008792 [Pipistrellus kuhlii]